MAETIAGTFLPSTTNHGRAVYKRTDPPSDGKVLLYYWDERDGEDNKGWWFGPEVGGEEVWAHNMGSPGSHLPPARGWRVLHSGAVDPAMSVTRVDAAPTTAKAAASRPGATPGATTSSRPGAATPSRPGAPPNRPGAAPSRPGAGAAPSTAPSSRPRPTHPPTPPPAPGRPGPGPSSVHGLRQPAQMQPRNKNARSQASDDPRAAELRDWLNSLDDGAGAMLQYFEVLSSEFDSDLSQIAAAKVEGGEKRGILSAVDPSFWDTIRVAKTGHKMLFARGIAKL